MEKLTIQQEYEKDVRDVMHDAMDKLAVILTPVMHDKLKYNEAMKFVTSGKLKKAFVKIKVIIESYDFLRSRIDEER